MAEIYEGIIALSKPRMYARKPGTLARIFREIRASDKVAKDTVLVILINGPHTSWSDPTVHLTIDCFTEYTAVGSRQHVPSSYD